MARIILHVDLDAFYVRAEELRHPELKDKAVIIGRTGRKGIVSTCSYKARSFGVRSGMPTFQALRLCPRAIVLPGDQPYYLELSQLFISYLKGIAPAIEQVSIDECFLDLTERLKGEKDVQGFLIDLQRGLLQKTGLSCSIGVGPTKFLAKMASDLKKPKGITIIHRKDIRKILSPLPILACYGIGKKTAPKLERLNIKTIGDLLVFLDRDDPVLRKLLGSFFTVLKDWLNGRGDDRIDPEPRDLKSIGHSMTLLHDVTDIKELNKEALLLVKAVTCRARRLYKKARTITLTLKDAAFQTITRSKTLQEPIDDEKVIGEVVSDLLSKHHHGAPIRLIGVTLSNLLEAGESLVQLSLFDDERKIEEEGAVRLLIGKINRRFKRGVLLTAGDYLKEGRDGFR